MSQIEWGDPPELKNPGYGELLEELLGRPGEWGLLRTFASEGAASGQAYRLRKDHPTFEFTSRRLAGGGSAVWGRCVR